MSLEGKGFYIWKIKYCEGGDVRAIANLAEQAELSHVLVKVANANWSYNIDPMTNQDLVGPLVKELKKRDIAVWGWQYVLGNDPVGEADKAIQRVREFNLDGFVIDAESEYKEPGKEKAAERYMARLRMGLPRVPIALSSYRYPSYHPQLPWDEFLSKCDIAMPQVYWVRSHNPGRQLERCVNEYRTQRYIRPVIPTGSAYKQWEWVTTPEDINELMEKALELKLKAVNFWEWSHTRKYLSGLWDTVSDFKWSADSVPDIGREYIDALNSHNPDQVLRLYTQDAIHVTSERTIRGKAAIRDWYEDFFRKILPNAVFYLIDTIGTGKIRHVTWRAYSRSGKVDLGSDTIAVTDGKVSYHYTFYVIT